MRRGLGLLVAVLLLTGCNKTQSENELLTQENESLRSQLTDRNQALESAHSELRDKDQLIAQLRGDLSEAGTAMVDPFEGIPGVTGSVGAGEVTATVESDVLFDPGRATLRPAAKKSLDSVAEVISSGYSGKTVRVTGHTDTDPIKKSGYKSNHHLGFERAYAVRSYLVSQGVPASRVYVASYGPDRSLATKKQSRRVEIAVELNPS